MRPKEVAERLGIDESTLRLWSSDEFKAYLSPRAQGGDGRHRSYTEQDARILAYVKEMKDENTSIDEIHAGLKSLQAVKWVGLPILPDAPGAVVSMIPREAAETRVDIQRQTHANEIQEYQKRIADIEARLEKSEDQREILLRERADLMKRVGELEGQLSERQSTRFWLVVVAVVGAVVVIVTVVLIFIRAG